MTQKKPIIAANWKMHKTGREVEEFFNTLMPQLNDVKVQVWIAPSATIISLAAQKTQGSIICIGAQNIYHESHGAFTGEISAAQARDAGARFVIVGHSERRRLFGETNAQVKKKIELAREQQLIPLLCVGETLEERERGQIKSVLKAQLTEVLDERFEGVVAYEPVWAIGTGKSASREMIEEGHAICREILTQVCKKENQISLLYGGSVSAEIASSLGTIKDVDGALVGSASLEAQTFISIIRGYLQ